VRLHLSLVVAIVVASGAARAQDFVGARALGLGEAYRAIATGNDAIYFNPAGLPLLKRYSLEGQYLMNLVDENHQADISVVDSKTNPLAVGLAYTFQGSELSRRPTLEHTATLAIGYPIFERWLSLGAGFKYKNVSDAIAGNYLNAVSADVGAIFAIDGAGLSFAAVGYNLIPIRSVESQHIPVSSGFAFAWDLGPASSLFFGGNPALGAVQTAAGIPSQPPLGTMMGPLSGLTISGDWLINYETLYGTRYKLSAGVEYLLADLVPLRLGYLFDEVDGVDSEHRVSAGLGVILPYFGFDISYQQTLPAGDTEETRASELDTRVLSIALKGFLPL
jgi:hypothetical protein